MHELYHKATEQQNILMFFNCLTGCDTCNAFYGTEKKLANEVMCRMPKSEQLACTKFVELLYGKKQCKSFNEL